MSEIEHAALEAAARDALQAPSVFNTQPWGWLIDGSGLTLRADWSRQLTATDPDGHWLLLSCGAALHHALVSLAAAGWKVVVDRPSPPAGDVLARLHLVGRCDVGPASIELHDAIFRRRTDRRPFADTPVDPQVVRDLVAVAEAQGIRVHPVGLSQMPMLAIAVAMAGSAEMVDPEYRGELIRWTNRPEWSRDGVPATTAVQNVARRVPVREFALDPQQGLPVDAGGDRGAIYLLLYGSGTSPDEWLRAGEALSAVLLTAVSRGLAVAPITDVLEVEHPRALVSSLLPNHGEPYVVVRCGHPVDTTPLAAAPRREPGDVIQGSSVW
jgi:nitroreductase